MQKGDKISFPCDRRPEYSFSVSATDSRLVHDNEWVRTRKEQRDTHLLIRVATTTTTPPKSQARSEKKRNNNNISSRSGRSGRRRNNTLPSRRSVSFDRKKERKENKKEEESLLPHCLFRASDRSHHPRELGFAVAAASTHSPSPLTPASIFEQIKK